MMAAIAALDAARATNLWGRLGPDARRRLDAVIAEPSPETWDQAYSLIIDGERFITLWQAVLIVDPTFPPAASSAEDYPDRWPRIPTRRTLVAALRLAVQH